MNQRLQTLCFKPTVALFYWRMMMKEKQNMEIKIPDDFGHRLLQAALVIQRDGSYQDYLNAISGRARKKECVATIPIKE